MGDPVSAENPEERSNNAFDQQFFSVFLTLRNTAGNPFLYALEGQVRSFVTTLVTNYLNNLNLPDEDSLESLDFLLASSQEASTRQVILLSSQDIAQMTSFLLKTPVAGREQREAPLENLRVYLNKHGGSALQEKEALEVARELAEVRLN